jgi:hypothetical protein
MFHHPFPNNFEKLQEPLPQLGSTNVFDSSNARFQNRRRMLSLARVVQERLQPIISSMNSDAGAMPVS